MGSSTGRRKAKVKKSLGSRGRPSRLLNLSPQERLVKKVQETLRNDNNGEESLKDLTRPLTPRKKVIFRKKKEGEDSKAGIPRISRSFRPGSSKIKSVKVRVRRIDEVSPFPIV